MIAGHEVVVTGSHHEGEYWGDLFVVRCFECPGRARADGDLPIYVGPEATDPRDYLIDHKAMFAAIAEHVGWGQGLDNNDVEGAVLIAALDDDWESGLRILEERTRESRRG